MKSKDPRQKWGKKSIAGTIANPRILSTRQKAELTARRERERLAAFEADMRAQRPRVLARLEQARG